MRLLCLTFAVLLAPWASAQEINVFGAYTSQTDPLGVRALAMGGAGAFLPDPDPLAFAQNPARLAAAAETPMLRFSLDGHPDFRALFGGYLGTGIGYATSTYAVGPGVIGVTGSRLTDESQATDAQGNEIGEARSGDRALAVGGAVRIGDSRAHLDLGATARLTRVFYEGFFTIEDTETLSATEPSFDLGAIATVHVLKPRALRTGAFSPTLNVSAGYTQRSIGPDFTFREEASQAFTSPQDRTGSAGASAQFGLDAQYAGGPLRLVALDVATEALSTLNTGLYNVDTDSLTVSRSPLVGSMRVRDAILGTSSSQTVEGQRGARLTVAEAVWVAVGRSESNAEFDRRWSRSWGVGVSVGGALRAIGALQNDAEATALGQRLDVTLAYARDSGYSSQFGELDGEPLVETRLFQVGGAVRL